MRLPDYNETLTRYGLERLKGGDLQVRGGNIAITADGDLQFGDIATNALFRLVQRWRAHQPTLNDLFSVVQLHSQRHSATLEARRSGFSPSLVTALAEFHEENDCLAMDESGASIYAGTICLVVNNLLQRFKTDVQTTDDAWRGAEPILGGEPLGEIFAAAANNFRHHDEWARTHQPTSRQMRSISVLQHVLGMKASSTDMQRIRTNLCSEVILLISEGEVGKLHERMFAYAKSVCDFPVAR